MKELNFQDMASGQSKDNLKNLANKHICLNGKKNEDGSMGEVKISPSQFLDLLYQAYLEGYHDH